MPELPDVEVFRRYVAATSLHKTIDSVTVCEKKMLGGVSARTLQSHLKGRSFEEARRHGKYLFLQLEQAEALVLHFGMTGFVVSYKHTGKRPPHMRMELSFDNGYHLACDSQRKLGVIVYVTNIDDFLARQELGPDVLEDSFGVKQFGQCFEGSKASVKSVLMNQKLMAGIGNVYSDEILFQAGMHPRRQSSQLSDRAISQLFRSMHRVLAKTIDCNAEPDRFPASYLTPRRSAGSSCPRCGDRLKSEKVSGRTAWFCSACQT